MVTSVRLRQVKCCFSIGRTLCAVMACKIISMRDIVFNKDWLVRTVFTEADTVCRVTSRRIEMLE